MTANVQIGKPKAMIRYSTRSRVLASGSERATAEKPGAWPAVTSRSYRRLARWTVLTTPEIISTPVAVMAAATWTISQYELSTGCSGSALA